ncbi:MAG: TetR/AcrR family transcriptional regulator [bacterium]|nr:TetR/AcrR family transcriptional regulator [bacterium]
MPLSDIEAMAKLTPKQRQIRERDQLILGKARAMLLADGYFGITMDRIAEAADCPKGTMYERFRSKEDIVMALAHQCLVRRHEMLKRGAAFEGLTRARMMAIGEGASLYVRLNQDDSRIIHSSTGPVRQKASAKRIKAVEEAERMTIELVRSVLVDALVAGELRLKENASVDEMAFGLWSLVEGGFSGIEADLPRKTLRITSPFRLMYRVFNVLADGYGWRPLLSDDDWEDRFAAIRESVFPDEAQQVYGEGNWHGDNG